MPHFENIDQYEAKNSRSGRKKIIPIAPHSMQAVDYQLSKESQPKAPRKKSKPAFPPVEFDPISVRQMEKEFKQAARADARRGRRPSLGARLKKLKAFIASLFGKKKAEKPTRRNRSRRRKQGDRPARKTARKTEEESGSSQNRNRRSRNRRPRNRSKGKGAAEGPKAEAKGNSQEKPSAKKRSNRSRRGRRPPNRQNQRSRGNKGPSQSDS